MYRCGLEVVRVSNATDFWSYKGPETYRENETCLVKINALRLPLIKTTSAIQTHANKEQQRMDQYCRLGRTDCHWWPFGISIDRGSHLLHDPVIQPTTMAPVPHLYWLQPLRVLSQCLPVHGPPNNRQSRIHLVDLRICHHLYHSPGVRFPNLSIRSLCLPRVHQPDWLAGWPCLVVGPPSRRARSDRV
jgi:hypothetical protein